MNLIGTKLSSVIPSSTRTVATVTKDLKLEGWKEKDEYLDTNGNGVATYSRVTIINPEGKVMAVQYNQLGASPTGPRATFSADASDRITMYGLEYFSNGASLGGENFFDSNSDGRTDMHSQFTDGRVVSNSDTDFDGIYDTESTVTWTDGKDPGDFSQRPIHIPVDAIG